MNDVKAELPAFADMITSEEKGQANTLIPLLQEEGLKFNVIITYDKKFFVTNSQLTNFQKASTY